MNIEIFNITLFILFAVVWISWEYLSDIPSSFSLSKNITEGFDSYFQFGY